MSKKPRPLKKEVSTFRLRSYLCVGCQHHTDIFGEVKTASAICPTCEQPLDESNKQWDLLVKTEKTTEDYPS